MASVHPPVANPTNAPGARSWVERLWSTVAVRSHPYAEGLQPDQPRALPEPSNIPPDAPKPPLDRAQERAEALLSERGEASGAAIARELHAALRELDAEGRLAFYRFLAENFLPAEDKLRTAAQAYLAEPTPERATQLGVAAEPARQELLRRMNMVPGGTAALVAMRKDLLGYLHQEPNLKPLDSDLRHLLGSWFNRGFLELRRIDWQTPAAVLEKLIAYEAVHEIQGWDDLRRRLAPDRRCFGFFHPALPGEPLIFVEVALTTGLASSVQPLLARDGTEAGGDESERVADTAIFYSISNCQDGLRGVSFGNFLIKQVVEELKAELPGLVRFSTLSPVPGFRRWLEKQLTADDAKDILRQDEMEAALRAAKPIAEDGGAARAQSSDVDTTSDVNRPLKQKELERESVNITLSRSNVLRGLLETDRWWEDAACADALRDPLRRLCATYLTTPDERRAPADPVARFHLGNGARLERVNWLGNVAPRGIKESYGIMVNYLYDPQQIEANHEAFVRGAIARSAAVDDLLGTAAPTATLPQPATRPRQPRKD